MNLTFSSIALFFCGCCMVTCPSGALSAPPEVLPDIAGWRVVREPVVYDASSLWEAIDGAADLFVSYGVLDMHLAYYSTTGGPEVRAEAYHHDSPETAFGIFSQERSAGNAHVNIGTTAVMDEGMLNILCGSYYVKLSTNTPGKAAAEALSAIGSAIAKYLAQPVEFPPMLAVLPVQNRVPNSEQFIADSYLGYSFLRRAYTARYGATGVCEVFLLAHENAGQALLTLNAYEKVTAPAPGDSGVQHIRVRDEHHGLVDLVLRGKMLGGIRGCPDSSLRSTVFRELQDRMEATQQ